MQRGSHPKIELQKDYDPLPQENTNQLRVPEEYELVYNDEVQPLLEQSDRPIHLRSKYPSSGNRDVRSGDLDSTSSSTPTVQSPSSTTGLPISAQSPLSLWDLELDNEAREQAADADAKKQKRRRKRREQSSASSTTTSAGDDVPGGDTSTGSDWYLASISSTGVLLKALGNASSSLDFAFVLNIRESEAYPPLFSPQDLSCVEEKVSAYKSKSNSKEDSLRVRTENNSFWKFAGYTIDSSRLLRKQFLKECLSERLVDAEPALPKYESQLVVTRIGITCSCRSLQPGEVCSELDPLESQRWTEFMGNSGHGFYANH